MKCIDCHNESEINARACTECLERSRKAVVTAKREYMDYLDRNLVLCNTPNETRNNRRLWHKMNIELLINDGLDINPRRKKSQRERNDIFQNLK